VLACVAAVIALSSTTQAAADVVVNIRVDLSSVVRTVEPSALGFGSSTYGANPLDSTAQAFAEQQLDARYVRLPVGWRNGRVTSSAAGGPTDLDIPALTRLYTSWGYRVLVVIGGRTNDFDVQPGDAANIIRAIGTGANIDYSAPNEPGNQHKTVHDEIRVARMIVAEGKAITPGFRVWGPVWSYYDRAALRTFAAALGQDLAGIDYHHYAMGGTSLTTAQALSETPRYGTEIREIRADLKSVGLGDRPINVDELNFSWRYKDGTPGGNNRFFTTVTTVWVASTLGHILTAGGRGLVYASQNGPLGVMVEAGQVNPDNRSASSPMPAYWGIAAFTGNHKWPHYKDAVLKTSDSDPLIEAFATNNEAGGYTVVLVNKSERADKAVSVSLDGAGPGTYTAYQTRSTNPYDPPAKMGTGAYKTGASVRGNLPKMSVTIVVLKPAL